MREGYEQLAADAVYFNPERLEIIVTGCPAEDDENHNCDQMGCSSAGHVIFRAKANSFSYSPMSKKAEPYVYRPQATDSTESSRAE